MAKRKTRAMGWGVTAREVDGVWVWEIGSVEWYWVPDARGLNLEVVVDGERFAAARYRSLKDAAHFAQGFVFGLLVQQGLDQEARRGAEGESHEGVNLGMPPEEQRWVENA